MSYWPWGLRDTWTRPYKMSRIQESSQRRSEDQGEGSSPGSSTWWPWNLGGESVLWASVCSAIHGFNNTYLLILWEYDEIAHRCVQTHTRVGVAKPSAWDFVGTQLLSIWLLWNRIKIIIIIQIYIKMIHASLFMDGKNNNRLRHFLIEEKRKYVIWPRNQGSPMCESGGWWVCVGGS